MKPKAIKYSSYFIRQLKRLTLEEKAQLVKFEAIFMENCFHASLKTHKLSGNFAGFWSCSLTYKIRVIFQIEEDNSITLVNIGSHQIYR